MAERRLVFAHDVKELLNGLESIPWEEEVDYLVDALPTPNDVEVVVRCKDCKHWSKKDFQGGDDIYHMEFGGFCPNSRFARYESDFCSYGERRDSDG